MFPHRFLILIVAMVLLASASAWAVADELEDILQAGVIRIGVPQDLPPFGSVSSSGQLECYDVDVARLVAKDLGVKLELYRWQASIASHTCRREKWIWSSPVSASRQTAPRRSLFPMPMRHFSPACSATRKSR